MINGGVDLGELLKIIPQKNISLSGNIAANINIDGSVSDLKQAIKDNISIILAPEGTFNETSKPLINFYDGAVRIAIETKTSIKPLLFLDTYDRLHYSKALSLTPGKSRVVYLEEISVEGFEIEDLPVLKQKVYDSMESALIRYKATWIKD